MLQPLDAAAFALYKATLVARYHDARTRCGGPHGDLNIAEFLPCVYETIRRSQQGHCWGRVAAFDRSGFGAHQKHSAAKEGGRAGCEALSSTKVESEKHHATMVTRPSDVPSGRSETHAVSRCRDLS